MEIYPSTDMQQTLADLKIKIFPEAFLFKNILCSSWILSPEWKYFQKNAPFNYN